MNKERLEQIFQRYLEKFDEMNITESSEWYKWKVAKDFPEVMNQALASADEAFPDALRKAERVTEDLLDNQYVYPFSGLCQIADKEPGTVRSMFLDLYADDGGDLVKRSDKLHTFKGKCEELCERYLSGNARFRNDPHAVTIYLALHDPDHNYIYKAAAANKFADAVEFPDEWGSGASFHLDIYYRMCDELVAAIREHESFLHLWQEQMKKVKDVHPEELHPDREHHILAYDIIYASVNHNLLADMTIIPRRPKSRPAAKEQNTVDIEALKAKFLEADGIRAKRQEAETYLQQVLVPGTKVHHKNEKFGEGIIQKAEGMSIEVLFPNYKTKPINMSTDFIAARGLFDTVSNAPDFIERTEAFRDVLLKKQTDIQKAYEAAYEKIKPYLEDL